MSQTKEGAAKARDTMRERYGPDYYEKLGEVGNKARKHRVGGFKAHPDKVSEWGRRGGIKSRPKKLTIGVPMYENQRDQ